MTLVLAIGTPTDSVPAETSPPTPIEARLFFEWNATDGDLGLHLFADAAPWRTLDVADSSGATLLRVEAGQSLGELGITELHLESAEPTAAAVLARFPSGPYTIRFGFTSGERDERTVELIDDLPDSTSITSPRHTIVDRDDVVMQWTPVPGAIAYEVVVEEAASEAAFTVDLDAATTSIRVPPEFLQFDTPYDVKVLALDSHGNATITESPFVTAPRSENAR